jgi:hypothetical protein
MSSGRGRKAGLPLGGGKPLTQHPPLLGGGDVHHREVGRLIAAGPRQLPEEDAEGIDLRRGADVERSERCGQHLPEFLRAAWPCLPGRMRHQCELGVVGLLARRLLDLADQAGRDVERPAMLLGCIDRLVAAVPKEQGVGDPVGQAQPQDLRRPHRRDAADVSHGEMMVHDRVDKVLWELPGVEETVHHVGVIEQHQTGLHHLERRTEAACRFDHADVHVAEHLRQDDPTKVVEQPAGER